MGAIAMIYYIETKYLNNLIQKEKDKWIELLIKLETSDIASLAWANDLLTYNYLIIDNTYFRIPTPYAVNTLNVGAYSEKLLLTLEKLHELVLLKLIGN